MDFSLKIAALYSPIFVSLVWGITLYLKNYRTKKPGYYMSFVQFSVLAIFASLVPFYHQKPILNAQMDALFYAGLLSIFPFVYIYVRHIATKVKKELKQLYIHLLPALLFTIVGLLVPFILSVEELKMYALSLPVDKELHLTVFFFQMVDKISKLVFIVQSILYLYLISILIKEFKSRMRNYFSNIENRYFNWIHIFYITFLISLFAAIPVLILGNNYMVKEGNHLLTVCFLILCTVFYLISFIADNHSYIDDESFYSADVITTIEINTIIIKKTLLIRLKIILSKINLICKMI